MTVHETLHRREYDAWKTGWGSSLQTVELRRALATAKALHDTKAAGDIASALRHCHHGVAKRA